MKNYDYFDVSDFLSRDPSAPVCVTMIDHEERVTTRGEMLRDFNAARRALFALNAPRFVLFESDAYRFLVWLTAAWANGQTVVLVPEDLPTFRETLTLAWVGSDNEKNTLRDWQHAFREDGSPQTEEHNDSAGKPICEFFTSGSTGSSKLITKKSEQLWREGAVLNRVFAKDFTDGTRFAATVPHHHMFGMPFYLFFPFLGGFPFANEKFPYPEDLLRLPPKPHVLISSPATLKRLAQLPHVTPQANITAVFAAGSPLPQDVALAVKAQLRTRVVEIYGSTETGYVASREAPDTAWHLQPDVSLSINEENGCLSIRSPLLPDDNYHHTQDRAKIDERGMHLLGRADRIVKIEGQRVSLDAIERALKEQPEVAEVRAIPLYGEREEIVAAVVLTDDARQILRDKGKASFDRMLRRRCQSLLTRAAIPRRWRYPEEMPVNDMGKTPQSLIAELFHTRPLPAVAHSHRDERNATLQLFSLADTGAFDGHFPTLPILPGVTEVDWAIRFAQRYLSLDKHCDVNAVTRIAQLKFQRVVRPQDALDLSLTLTPETKKLAFRYTLKDKPDEKVASGVICFA
jgi:acyl-CoA synthetase (AMP-forming)/AMP-acid ligase II/3-hydroxymyristoyl/3-hydroxydecanoyl-(acyl carrier protein) dehydratase